MRKKDNQLGQAGLVVMLIMVVLLTLGVSIASRSTQDVAQSTQEQETSRVFDAAEAGIEQALSGVLTATGNVEVDIGEGLSASYSVDEVRSLEVRLDEGQVVAVDLAGAYAGNVEIQWSKVSNCNTEDPASIEVVMINPVLNSARRLAFSGCTHTGDRLIATSNLPLWSVGAGTTPYVFRATVQVDASDELMRIRPIYNDTHLKVTGGVNFPVQYHRINAQASNPISGETRAVQVDRTLPTAPAIFDYVLFSGTNLTK